ncbi:MAG: hypothetical protein K6L80_16390 [Agarilytica sp.]
MYLKIVKILPLILLAGCSAHPAFMNKYPKIEYEENAAIRFTGAGQVDIYYSQIDQCKREGYIGEINGVYLGNNRKDMNLPLGENIAKRSKTEIPIRANENITINLSHVSSGYSSTLYCDVYFSLTPQKGVIYESRFIMRENSCTSKLFRIQPQDGGGFFRVHEEAAKAVYCDK